MGEAVEWIDTVRDGEGRGEEYDAVVIYTD